MLTIEITKAGQERRKMTFDTVEEYCSKATELVNEGYKLGWDFTTTLNKYNIYFPFFEISKAKSMLAIADQRFG